MKEKSQYRSYKTQQTMDKWTSALENITGQSVSAFGRLSDEQLNWKPDPNTWSIAQNLDHLMVVNQTYYPVLASLTAGNYRTPFIAKFGFVVSFLGKTVLKAVQPDRQTKMKTFPIWEPAASKIDGDIVAKFEKHQTELIQKIRAAQGLVEKGVVISSPANRNIVYKLETAFDIIVSHEQRHLAQAIDVLRAQSAG
ncbi:MAG: DinB family protein [Saprospiraceae bacterium]|nr:DinB family protein [Saprospiraceae bacterium]